MCDYLQTPKHYFLERFLTRCSPKATSWVWLNQPCRYSEIVKTKWAWGQKTWVQGLVLTSASGVGFWTFRLSCMFIFSSICQTEMKLFISQDCSEGLSFKAPQSDMMTIIFAAECLIVNHGGTFQNNAMSSEPHAMSGVSPGFSEWKVCLYLHAFWKDSGAIGLWLRTNFISKVFKFILILSLVKEWGMRGKAVHAAIHVSPNGESTLVWGF